MRLTLVTYNVHACVGGDGRFDPERTVKVLKEIDADIVALQEVEDHPVGGSDLLDYMASAVGLSAIPGPTMLRETRGYGNALLTRLPVLAANRIDLSLPRREPRGALDVTLDWGGQVMRVVATHLGLRPGERRAQIRRLLALFESYHAGPGVLLGDLNEWLLWGRPLRWLNRHFASTPHPRTYPARFPLFDLDRIWVRPRTLLRSVETHTSPLARLASDHLPHKAVLMKESRDQAASRESGETSPYR
jgi:endonuclease/exonuclease/phosphatase family metal-dependent hydrolase